MRKLKTNQASQQELEKIVDTVKEEVCYWFTDNQHPGKLYKKSIVWAPGERDPWHVRLIYPNSTETYKYSLLEKAVEKYNATE